MTIRFPLALAAPFLAMLCLATGAAAMGDLPPWAGARPNARPDPGARQQGAAFACAFTAREGAGGVAIEGRVEARAPVSGSYALRVRGGGVSVDQSGDFSARAGETITLGSAQLSGSAAALDATMSLTAGGRTTHCPLRRL